MAKRVYLAGPMRALLKWNFPAFDEAKARGEQLGFVVESPADLDRLYGFDPIAHPEQEACWNQNPREVIQRDIEALLRCDAIALLPGWERSTGARAELMVAFFASMEVLDARDFQPYDVAAETIEYACEFRSFEVIGVEH